MKNNQLADKLIKYVTDAGMREPNIRFRDNDLELIWSNDGNLVKAHIDEYGHTSSLVTYTRTTLDLNEEQLLESLRTLYQPNNDGTQMG